MKTYGQRLAQMVLIGFSYDPAEGTGLISTVPVCIFPWKLVVEEKIRAMNLAKGEIADLTLWCDWSKVDQDEAAVEVV